MRTVATANPHTAAARKSKQSDASSVISIDLPWRWERHASNSEMFAPENMMTLLLLQIDHKLQFKL